MRGSRGAYFGGARRARVACRSAPVQSDRSSLSCVVLVRAQQRSTRLAQPNLAKPFCFVTLLRPGTPYPARILVGGNRPTMRSYRHGAPNGSFRVATTTAPPCEKCV